MRFVQMKTPKLTKVDFVEVLVTILNQLKICLILIQSTLLQIHMMVQMSLMFTNGATLERMFTMEPAQ